MPKIKKTNEHLKDNASVFKKKGRNKIKFSSNSADSLYGRIELGAEYKELFLKDFIYYLNGGQDDKEKIGENEFRERIGTLKNYARTLQRIKDRIQEKIDKTLNNLDDRESMEIMDLESRVKNYANIQKYLTNIWAQPIEILNMMSEGDFTDQKALQGVIYNDKGLTENNNIVNEDNSNNKQLTQEGVRDDLRQLGAEIMKAHIKTIDDKDKSLN